MQPETKITTDSLDGPSKESKVRLYVIRHAESEYNAAMKTAIRLDRETFAHEEDHEVKFSPHYIDCGLSEKGLKQC
jgi:broad specificity phosphatase PhoE